MKAIAAILICLAIPAAFAREVVTRDRFTVNFTIPANACTVVPADVHLVGEGQFVASVIMDGSQITHMSTTVTVHGTATDANGNKYVFNHVDTFSRNAGGDQSPLVITATEVFYLIGLGDAPNVPLHGVFHTTVLPNGTVVVEFERETGAEGCFPG